MKRKIKEDVEIQIVSPITYNDLYVESLITEWAGIPYAQLSVTLVYLQFLAQLHKTHHWTSLGDPFYGDHLMFERMYDAVTEEIDTVAEKAVGLGSAQNVDLLLVTSQVNKLVSSFGMSQTVPTTTELVRRSFQAELTFLKSLEVLSESMNEQHVNTMGVENMMQGIADAHEKHVYFLKQKCKRGM
jgi:DNA-binding ferritin-like protein